jgi:hypothetical protein
MGSGPVRHRTVRGGDSARISQAGVNPDEENTDMFADREGRLMMTLYAREALYVREATYQSALAAAARAIQPSLAAFLQ